MHDAIDAVLFDVDNTICEYRRTGADLLPVAFQTVGAEQFFTVEEYHERYREFTDESENMRELRERCFAALARERDRDPEIGRAVARAYAAERDHSNVRFLPGARETLEALQGSVRLAAVTNGGPEMQSTKLDSLGVRDAFETIVYAGYDTPPKPAAEPFYTALSEIGVRPERATHVGDSLESDVAGANNAGLQATWLKNETESTESDHEPDYVLESVDELAEFPWEP